MVICTRGSLLFPGDAEIKPEHRGVQTWTVHRENDEWPIESYQNTRLWKFQK